jgi:hypothetical protein
MPSTLSVPTTGRENRSRRAVLAAVGTGTALSIAGCSGLLPRSPGDADADPAEVVVENGTASPATVAVRISDGADETVFSRVFTLGPEEIHSRGAIESAPDRVHAFTPDGTAAQWAYDPDLPVDFDCDIKDVGLTLTRDGGFEPWYDC